MSASASPGFLEIPRLSRIPRIVHGFGTRHGTLEDFKKGKEWSGFKAVWLHQLHSDTVHFIDASPKRRLQGDALATDRPGILIIIKTADCLPVFLVDEAKLVIAAVHCGWRGTQRRILERVVHGLRERYGCEPASLLAAFGPCIGPSCYEVGEDVRQSFLAACLDENVFKKAWGKNGSDKTGNAFLHSGNKEMSPKSSGKYLLDLRKANRRQLIGQGLRPENMLDVSLCTHCDDRLLSWRRDRNKSARLYSFVAIVRQPGSRRSTGKDLRRK